MIFEMTAAKRGGTVFFLFNLLNFFLFLSKILAEQHSYLLGAIELESVSGACEEGTHLLEPYAGAAVSVFSTPEVDVTNHHNHSQQMGVLD